MCKKRSTRISHSLVLCASFRETMYSVNRLQSTSHENSYRGPTRGLIEFNFFYTYSRVNGLCFGYFQIFPKRSPFDQKLRYPILPMYPDFLTIRYTCITPFRLICCVDI